MPDNRLEIVLAGKDATAAAFKAVSGRVSALSSSLFSLRGSIATLASTSGLGLLISNSLSAADAIAKTSDKLGISTTALQEYRYAAERSGVTTATLDMAMQRFTRRVAEAAQEKGELRAVLEQYNIAVFDTAGNTRRTEDVFRDLADVIQQTEDPAERLRIAFKAFDSEGAALVNMLRNGSSGLDDFSNRARELGLILDDKLFRGAEKAKDSLDDMYKVIQVSFSKVVLQNIDSITAAIKALAQATNLAASAFGKIDRWLNVNIGGQLESSVKETYLNNLETRAADLQRRMDLARRSVPRLEQEEFLKPMLQQYDLLTRKIQLVKGELIDRRLKKFFNEIDAYQTASNKIAPPPNAAGNVQSFAQKTSMKHATMAPLHHAMSAHEYSRFVQHDALVRDAKKSQQSIAEANAEAYEAMDAHVKAWEKSTIASYRSIDERMNAVSYNMSDSLADFFETGKLNAKDFANSVISDLIRIQSRMLVSGLFENIGGGVFAGLFHGGGTVGAVSAGRFLPAATFAGARRLHQGLAPDEYPAILQRGETVLPRGQGPISINVPITINGAGIEAGIEAGGVAGRLRSAVETTVRDVLHQELK